MNVKNFFHLLILNLAIYCHFQAKAQFVPFSITGASHTYVTCINDSGDIAGYYSDGTGIHGFIYKYNVNDTVFLNFPGALQTYVYGINNSLEVVGAYNTTGNTVNNEGFYYNSVLNTYTDITSNWIPNMDYTIARDINDAGLIVGDYKQGTTHVCFSMYGGNNTPFHYNYNPTYINSVNNTGKRVGFWIDGSYRNGLIYNNGSWTQINYPGATRTMMTSVNDSNIAVGVFNLTRSFIYRNGLFREIKKPGATDFQVRDINNKGIVAGYYKDASNVYKGFFMPIWDIGFRPNPNGWKFSNSDNNIWPESWYKQFDYQHDPYLGGDSYFPKMLYSNGTVDTICRWLFPDWPLFVEVLGEDQCYHSFWPFKVLKFSAFLKYTSVLEEWGGSCFGFVQSSFMVWDSIQRFKTAFPKVGNWSSNNKLYELPINEHNRKCINHLMVKQNQTAYWNYRATLHTQAPTVTLDQLKAMFLDKSKNERGLTIRNQNGSGGHIVNPYKIVVDSVNPNIEYIYVYDCNFPNDTTRKIKIDKSLNCWWYNISANAGVAASEWGGPLAHKGLFLSWPVRKWYAQINIDSFSKENPIYPKTGNMEVYCSQQCDFSIKDNLENVTGYLYGKILENIPGSSALISENGSATIPHGYLLPNNSYKIQMSNFKSSGAYCNIFSQNKIYQYSRTGALLSHKDIINYDASGIMVENPDNISKTISILCLAEDENSSMQVEVTQLEQSPNCKTKVSILSASNSVKLLNTGANTTYQLNARFVGQNGEARYKHSNIYLASNCAHIIAPDWNNLQTQSVKIYIDCGNNGSIDDSLLLPNQQLPRILTSLFSVSAASSSVTDTLYITNSGGGVLNWTVSSDSPTWLNIVSANSGINMGYVVFNIAANTAGQRTGTLTITGVNAENSPYTIPVVQQGVVPAPGAVNASDGTFAQGIFVNWDAVPGATHYKLYRSNHLGNNGVAITDWITSLNYTDTLAEKGKFYYYSVKAAQNANGLNESAFSISDEGWRACFTADFIYSGNCLNQPSFLKSTSTAHSNEVYMWDIGNNGNIDYYGNTVEHIFTQPGAHSVALIVSDNSLCADTVVKTINILPFPSINLVSDTVLCVGQNITLDAGSGFNSYLWSTGATTSTITLDTTGYGLGTSSIYVNVSTTNGCSAFAMSLITWTICTATKDEDTHTPIMKIYPNPTDGFLNVYVENLTSKANIEIYNLAGQLIYFKVVNEHIGNYWQESFDFSNLHNGIYIIRVVSDGLVLMGKAVVY